jgi:hypothetical protein
MTKRKDKYKNTNQHKSRTAPGESAATLGAGEANRGAFRPVNDPGARGSKWLKIWTHVVLLGCVTSASHAYSRQIQGPKPGPLFFLRNVPYDRPPSGAFTIWGSP